MYSSDINADNISALLWVMHKIEVRGMDVCVCACVCIVWVDTEYWNKVGEWFMLYYQGKTFSLSYLLPILYNMAPPTLPPSSSQSYPTYHNI